MFKFCSFIEIKPYEELKGVDPKNPLPEYVGTYWTPIYDQNYGTPYEQWQVISLKFSPTTLKVYTLPEIIEKSGSTKTP